MFFKMKGSEDGCSFEQGNEISSASRFYNTNDDYIENKENRVPGSAHTNNSNSTANDKVSPLIPPPPTNSQPNIIAQPQSPAPSTKSSVFSPKQSNDINKNTLNQPPPPPSSSPPQTQQHFSLQPLKNSLIIKFHLFLTNHQLIQNHHQDHSLQ